MRALILMIAAQVWCGALAQADSPKMAGNWIVDVAFASGDTRSLRFDARDAGKGSLLLAGAGASSWGPTGPWEAKWVQGENGSVTISGSVEFPLGNVGRDAGTLFLKGKFGNDGLIEGEAIFFPLGQDSNDPKAKASKSGTFKATRAEGK